MTTPDAADTTRPDARVASQETATLRTATRALRIHLEKLPIDFDMSAPGGQVLAGFAFASARNRYSCAESMIGSGFGGTVIGSIARSLFVDALRWYWIGVDPSRRECLVGDLVHERNEISSRLDATGSTCPILPRWLMPLPDISNLVDPKPASATPSERYLLGEFLAREPWTAPAGPLNEARELLSRTELRGAVEVLAHAGHGNYLGAQSSFTTDGAIGHDLRADHEALFMHVAAVGAVVTLIGSASATPELWPSEIPQARFFADAIACASAVAAAALPIHRLRTTFAPPARKTSTLTTSTPVVTLPQAPLSARDLLPDVNSLAALGEAANDFFEFAQTFPLGLEDVAVPVLHIVLEYGAAHSNTQAVWSTWDQPGAVVISAFAARMLLEEAARTRWRFATKSQDEFKARSRQFFDEYRAKKKSTVNRLAGSGVVRSDAEAFFGLPGMVDLATVATEVTKNRVQLPSITSMLDEFGADYPEPGWLNVAYSLLSQVTHSTPIGLLHSIRKTEDGYAANALSTEMRGLALDVACLSSAFSIGHSSILMTDVSNDARTFSDELKRRAIEVHDLARMVHGLDRSMKTAVS